MDKQRTLTVMYVLICPITNHKDSFGGPLVEVVRPSPRPSVEPGDREVDMHLFISICSGIGKHSGVHHGRLRDDGVATGVGIPVRRHCTKHESTVHYPAMKSRKASLLDE